VPQEPSSYILSLPKAELHLHLEGAVEPATLVDLSRRYDAQPLTLAEVEKLYRSADFDGFLMAFKAVTERLQSPHDYERITYELMQRLGGENVLHAEVYLAAGVLEWRGRAVEPVLEAMELGRERGQRDFGVSLLWIFDAVRHFGPERAQRVAEMAVKLRDHNVVGFGIGGDERRAAPEIFRDVYAYAADHGLRLTAHAGESAGPESVWGALDALGAERIGHGLQAWKDPQLTTRLAREQVPVEICLSSNLRTACCQSLDQHPLKAYFDLGMMVTLNTDDPAMFSTSLAREYHLAQAAFGFSDEQIRALAENSFRASFLPEAKKTEFLKRFDKQASAN